jgi:hypothetical protein
VKALLGFAVLRELAAADDVTRNTDELGRFIDGRLVRRDHVLRHERAEVRIAGQHAGELQD